MAAASPIVRTFLAHLRDGAGAAGLSEQLGERLVEALDRAQRAWPELNVSPDLFVAYLAERLDPDTDVLTALAATRVDQLLLACGCAHGQDAALCAFETTFIAAVAPALRPMDRTGTLVEDTQQVLREKLLLAEGDRLPRIASYSGRGDLRRWVRAVAVRAALNLLRGTKKELAVGDDLELLAGVAGSDPRLAYMKHHYRTELKAAFANALASLSADDQTVLRYHHLDGLNIDEIGAIYRIHRVTAFRRLERARRLLISQTRKLLQKRLSVDRGELESIMRLIQSRLDVTIQDYFAQHLADDSS